MSEMVKRMAISEAHKQRARRAVRAALENGKLVRPAFCEKCGAPDKKGSDGRSAIHAHHHKGYDFPLDVEWLCPKCHFVHDPRPAKEVNGRSKLTSAQVDELRRRYEPSTSGGSVHRGTSPNSGRALAKEFGISQAQAHRIIHGDYWIDKALEE